MYLLFRMHNWKPSDFYNMGYGERKVTIAFLHKELDEIKEEHEEIERIRNGR